MNFYLLQNIISSLTGIVYEFGPSLVKEFWQTKKEKIVFTFNLKEFALFLQKHYLIHPSFLMCYCPNLLPRDITGLV